MLCAYRSQGAVGALGWSMAGGAVGAVEMAVTWFVTDGCRCCGDGAIATGALELEGAAAGV